MNEQEQSCYGGSPLSGSASPESYDESTTATVDGDAKDRSLSGASPGCAVPSQDGTGEPGNTDMMTRMMVMMMSKGGSPAPSDSGPMSNGAMLDCLSMLSKGSGIADMIKMVSNGGGMPVIMPKGIMPDMSAMMTKGGMQAGPMGMAKLFECIIDISLAKADSEASDDEDECAAAEIPCQYCSPLFSSQMSLKTHILVAHDQEDTSLLNLRDLIIDRKVRRGSRDGPRSKQPPPDDKSAAEASGGDLKVPKCNSNCKATSSQDDVSAAGSGRGLKRGRQCSWQIDISESGGAADEENLFCESLASSVDSDVSTENRKRKTHLRSQRSYSEESYAQAMPKRNKGAVTSDHSSCRVASPQATSTDVSYIL